MTKLQIENIPKELKSIDQWVRWEDMEDKKPIDPKYQSNQFASSTDPHTWGKFKQALSYCNGVGGIGFVFTSNDPYAGIDLDNCRDRRTGTINREAMLIARRLNSYTEISPSGKGLHILVKCKPFKGRREKLIEAYYYGQYLTVTGQHYEPTPYKIEYRDRELRDLIKVYFPSKRIKAMAREGIILKSLWG